MPGMQATDFAGSAIGAVGGAVSAGINYAATQATNAAQAAASNKQMKFQERMSSTAYQRAMEDMRRAGLNPMLAYGGGASSPAGSQPSLSAPQMEDFLSGNVSSALDARRLRKEIEATESQTALNDASRLEAEARTELVKSNAKTAAVNAAVAEADLPAARVAAQADLKKAEFDRSAATYDSIMNRVETGIGSITSAVSKLWRGREDVKNRRERETDRLERAGRRGLPTR